MRTSDQIDLIAPALLEVQGELPPIPRSATNPHFQSKYTPLDDINAIVLPICHKHGLAMLQGTSEEGPTGFCVDTTAIHASGQWVSLRVRVAMELQHRKDGSSEYTPQKSAISLTYGRRIGMAAFWSIVGDDDDDGNNASAFHQEFEPVKRSAPRPAPSGSIPSKCPTCGSKVYDNRPKKATGEYKPKSPDWSCSSKECKGDKGYRTGGWVEKDQADSDSQDHAPLDEEGGY